MFLRDEKHAHSREGTDRLAVVGSYLSFFCLGLPSLVYFLEILCFVIMEVLTLAPYSKEFS